MDENGNITQEKGGEQHAKRRKQNWGGIGGGQHTLSPGGTMGRLMWFRRTSYFTKTAGHEQGGENGFGGTGKSGKKS